MSRILEKLAAAEREFYAGEFLAPHLPAQAVTVRISGIILSMSVTPQDYAGWGIFRCTSRNTAELVRTATLSERQKYLELFPKTRLIISGRIADTWYGVRAQQPGITETIPLALPDGVQLFDAVLARSDGSRYWYEGPDMRHSQRIADMLRRDLHNSVQSPKISGLTKTELAIYQAALERRTAEIAEANRDHDAERLQAALAHAGAELRGYQDRGTVFTVEYMVDGTRHTSIVDKAQLTVQAAGICLSGGDRHFDLTSLVAVIREGYDRSLIRPVSLPRIGSS